MGKRRIENLAEWANKVDEWRRKYGSSNVVSNDNNRVFNIGGVVAVKTCRKCGAKRRYMSRHHKGHEYLFACIMEERYAARYIQFHPDDVDWLCDRCHTRAHVVISEIVVEVYSYMERCFDKRETPTFEELEKIRLKIIRVYEVWVNHKVKRRRKKRKNHYGKSTGK